MRFFLHLNYAGRNYHGWQIQPDHITVQGALERELSTILNGPVKVTGCGRTDTGVHAKAYAAHFDWNGPLPKRFQLRLNKMLPDDIAIQQVRRVRDDAHARFDARERTYKYFIHFRKDAFLQERSYWLHGYDFDMGKMNEAAGQLIGTMDFSAFEKKGGDNATSVCTVVNAWWEHVDEHRWCFTIRADRFLRNMVRRITGALLMAGTGRLSVKELNAGLNANQTLEVTFAPPAHGLYLWEVTYDNDIYID